MKKIIIILLVVLAVVGGWYWHKHSPITSDKSPGSNEYTLVRHQELSPAYEISYPRNADFAAAEMGTPEISSTSGSCIPLPYEVSEQINGRSFLVSRLQANGGTQSGEFVSAYRTAPYNQCYQVLFRIGANNPSLRSDSPTALKASRLADSIVETFVVYKPLAQ